MPKARDPVCGMDVDTETGIKRKIGDRTYYFCSQSCADVYEAPERELKQMRRRVAITLMGVIAAAGLRVLATFGLVAAIMAFEIVGGLSVYALAIFIVATPVVWIAGFSIIKGAYYSLRSRHINMDVLVTAGVLAGWAYGAANAFFPAIAIGGDGYLEIAVGILAFVLLGKYIEESIRRRSAASIRKLLELRPTIATVIRDGKEVELPVDEVQVNDTIIVKPGEKVPTDRVVGKFVPIVFTVATISFAYWYLTTGFSAAFFALLSVLLIACPCALGIATPTAILAGVGKGAEYGVLLSSGEYVERARKLKTVVFDKTGTLTKGEPSVTNITTLNGFTEKNVLRYAAIAEKGSEHPLAEAIINQAKKAKIKLADADSFEALPGRGVKCTAEGKKILLGNRTLMQEQNVQIETLENNIAELESQGKTVIIL